MEQKPQRPDIEILEKTGDWCLLSCSVPSNLLYFDGHFNGHPVLPGVVQIDWVIEFGKEMLGIQNAFSEMRQLKFQHLILPDAKVNLSLSFNRDKGVLNFRYYTDDNTFSSGRIVYKPFSDGVQ